MDRALDATGLHIQHGVIVAIAIMLELTTTRNAEHIVGSPLRDGKKSSSSSLSYLCLSITEVMWNYLFSGIMFRGRG